VPRHCFVVMSDPVPGREDEYNDWYSNRHLSDVLALEGFTAAQRFEFAPTHHSQEAPHRYLAIYEVEEDQLDTAVSALRTALEESRREEAEGRAPRMPSSPGLAAGRITWWFSAVTDRRTAS
jgi:hypothetical protein